MLLLAHFSVLPEFYSSVEVVSLGRNMGGLMDYCGLVNVLTRLVDGRPQLTLRG